MKMIGREVLAVVSDVASHRTWMQLRGVAAVACGNWASRATCQQHAENHDKDHVTMLNTLIETCGI